MKKKMMILMLALAGFSAHADDMAGKDLGLGSETGYEFLTTDKSNCSGNSALLTNDGVDLRFISKCDGSILGWVDKVIDGRYLSGMGSMKGTFSLRTVTRPYDRFGNDSIALEICGASRQSELVGHPEGTPASSPALVDWYFRTAYQKNRKLLVQLFFNEFVYSGKCIGKIKLLP